MVVFVLGMACTPPRYESGIRSDGVHLDGRGGLLMAASCSHLTLFVKNKAVRLKEPKG